MSKKNNFVGIVCRRDTKLRTVRQPQNVVWIHAIKNTLLHDPSFKAVNISNPVNPITNPSEENIKTMCYIVHLQIQHFNKSFQ